MLLPHGNPVLHIGTNMPIPIYPTPTGAPVNAILPGIGPGPINRSSSVAQIGQYLTEIGQNGAAYEAWANAAIRAQPSMTPYNAAIAWLAGTGGANAIGAAVGATGQAQQQINTGVAKALPSLDILGGFNLGSWFMRVGEILLGLVLIGVGVARITGVQNIISSAVKAKIP